VTTLAADAERSFARLGTKPMDMMSEMMRSMPMMDGDMGMKMDMALMQEVIETCSAASIAATMCADADTGADMARCCSMCMNTADVATTMMRMTARPMGYDMTVMSTMMTACIAMGEACAAECRMHAEMDEHCRICAMACDAMVDACRRAMSTMAA
jgi:hypothetical protein